MRRHLHVQPEGKRNVLSVNPSGRGDERWLVERHPFPAYYARRCFCRDQQRHREGSRRRCGWSGNGNDCLFLEGRNWNFIAAASDFAGWVHGGVLVQTNFGGNLMIAGVPVGKELGHVYPKTASAEKDMVGYSTPATPDGSCMIVVATDAPLDHQQSEPAGGTGDDGSGADRIERRPMAAEITSLHFPVLQMCESKPVSRVSA